VARKEGGPDARGARASSSLTAAGRRKAGEACMARQGYQGWKRGEMSLDRKFLVGHWQDREDGAVERWRWRCSGELELLTLSLGDELDEGNLVSCFRAIGLQVKRDNSESISVVDAGSFSISLLLEYQAVVLEDTRCGLI
jgi:hypothetical protein